VAAEAVSGSSAATEMRGAATEAAHAAPTEAAATEAPHAATTEAAAAEAPHPAAAKSATPTEVTAAESAAPATVAAATSTAVGRLGLVICRDREGEGRREKGGQTQFTHRHDVTLRRRWRVRVAARERGAACSRLRGVQAWSR
jgi:hypothetical protein